MQQKRFFIIIYRLPFGKKNEKQRTRALKYFHKLKRNCSAKDKQTTVASKKFKRELKFDGKDDITKLSFIKDKSTPLNNFKHLRTDSKIIMKLMTIYNLNTGIVERVSIDNKHLRHYLHHRTVIGSKQEITKMQIVFNKSAKYKVFPLLNNLLDPGPYLLPCLCDIIVCF